MESLDTQTNHIEGMVKQYNQIKNELNRLGNEILEEMKSLEKKTYGGLTYRQYVNTLNETIRHNDRITIKRENSYIYGEYQVNDDVLITIRPTVYTTDTITKSRIEYKRANRTLGEIPKKYQKEHQELIEVCFKYKVENVSDEYSQRTGISNFYLK